MTHYVRIGHNRVLMMLLPQKNRRRLLLSLEKLGAHPILQSFVGILVSCGVQKKERRLLQSLCQFFSADSEKRFRISALKDIADKETETQIQ